jgi:ribosomal protein L22
MCVFVVQGPYLRRFQPRAQGRAYAIRKPTCSIEVKMKSHDTSKRPRKPIKLSTH